MKLIYCEKGKKYNSGVNVITLTTLDTNVIGDIITLYETNSGKLYLKNRNGVILDVEPIRGINFEYII